MKGLKRLDPGYVRHGMILEKKLGVLISLKNVLLGDLRSCLNCEVLPWNQRIIEDGDKRDLKEPIE